MFSRFTHQHTFFRFGLIIIIRCGKIDCGFLTAPVTNELFFQKLYCDPMVAVLPQNHPLASKTALTFADIQEEGAVGK